MSFTLSPLPARNCAGVVLRSAGLEVFGTGLHRPVPVVPAGNASRVSQLVMLAPPAWVRPVPPLNTRYEIFLPHGSYASSRRMPMVFHGSVPSGNWQLEPFGTSTPVSGLAVGSAGHGRRCDTLTKLSSDPAAVARRASPCSRSWEEFV